MPEARTLRQTQGRGPLGRSLDANRGQVDADQARPRLLRPTAPAASPASNVDEHVVGRDSQPVGQRAQVHEGKEADVSVVLR